MATITKIRTNLAATPEGLMDPRVEKKKDVVKELEKIENAIFAINEALASLRVIDVDECSDELKIQVSALIAATNIDLLTGTLSDPTETVPVEVTKE